MNTKLPGSLVLAGVLFTLCLLTSACQGPMEPISFTTEMASVQSAASPSDQACAKRIEHFIREVTYALESVEPVSLPFGTLKLLRIGGDVASGDCRGRDCQLTYYIHWDYNEFSVFGEADRYLKLWGSAPGVLQGDNPPGYYSGASGFFTDAFVFPSGMKTLIQQHSSDVPTDIGNALGSNPNTNIIDPIDPIMSIDQLDCVIQP